MDAKTLCLAVLSLGDASAYEIKTKVETIFARFMDVAPSSLYSSVKALEQEGFITGTMTAQEKRPNKTTYRLLEPGRLALAQSLSQMEGRHRVRSELVALLMFAHLLPIRKLRDVLGARQEELAELSAELDAHPAPLEPGQRFVLAFGRSLVAAEAVFLRENLPALFDELESAAVRQAPAPFLP